VDEWKPLVCGKTDREDCFVLCDSCPNGGHYQCLGMKRIPKAEPGPRG